MCGFTGYIALKGLIKPNQLRSSLNLIAHRGPDDFGIELFDIGINELCLAHRRLSIIDLSSNGHQPFFDCSKRYAMVYNGEIYNYRELRQELRAKGHEFLTDSDTEVVLEGYKEWGVSAWKKFLGMFSIVIYDFDKKELIFARDAFGIKPFYYYKNANSIYFASEIPSLVELLPFKPHINLQRVFEYLVFDSYDYDESTFFNGIFQLNPGHYSIISLNEGMNNDIITCRWWKPNIEETPINFNDASERLKEMFLQSVKIHLRSDVPLGAALSGGIDSSAIVCAMRYLEPNLPISTFTYVANGTSINEESWADIVNIKVKANANKVIVSSNELAEDLVDLIKTQGEPFSGTSIYAQYRIFKKAKEKGIIVSLDGQGADEMLAGYFGYPEKRIESLLSQNKWFEAVKFSREWGKRLEKKTFEPFR